MLVEAVERPGSEGGIPRADVWQVQSRFRSDSIGSFVIRSSAFSFGCLYLAVYWELGCVTVLSIRSTRICVVSARSSSLFLQRVSSNSLRADLPSRRECARTGRLGHVGRRSSACVTNLNRLPYFVIGRRILGHPNARISRVSHRKGRGISGGPPPGDGPGVRFRRKGGEIIRV